ncbi:MAG: lipoyl(octanoyl) transferase LipB [Micavibrio sp.]
MKKLEFPLLLAVAFAKKNLMEFITAPTPVDYPDALAFMEERVAAIRAGAAEECVWFLEHPPLYTAGTSANAADLLEARFPVYETGRGGEYTYHGPGQRVAYVMLDLRKRQKAPDIKRYVCALEAWIIRALTHAGIKGERRDGRIGIWVQDAETEKKISAVGVRIRHWVTYHGVAINLNPDLAHFGGIVPCGIQEYGVTSIHDCGKKFEMSDLDRALRQEFDDVFSSL